MDPQPSAPPVVAVVVTCNPGPWLEETLSALASQDYPNLSVLVIDAASTDDPTQRVAGVLPTAYVRRLGPGTGFAQAANEVLTIVEGASHYLLCHDDVAPFPQAVRAMVEEAFRSNAGMVCPKLVEWDRPERLLSVGQTTDKFGVPSALVDRGELDQEQHDAVRDVFYAPGGCTLVRADLFASLGGFDPVIDLLGEDLNLSWRAQIAGARVLVVPESRVRHLEALTTRQRPGWTDPAAPTRAAALTDEHRIRTLLTCYGLFHLVRVIPQAIVVTLVHAAIELVTGRPRAAAATLASWPRALRSGRVLAARRAVQRQRTVSDREVRALQSRGSAQLRAFFRSWMGGERAAHRSPGLSLSETLQSGAWRLPTIAWSIVAVVLLFGTRSLIGHDAPGVGSLPVLTGGPAHWWRLWWSGWRPDGLGSPAPAPPALALLGLAGTILLGATGLLQHLLVLGPFVLGPLGAYRAARPWGSPRGRAAALIVYAAVPAPYNALASGRWGGLVMYAAAPWLLTGMIRLSGDEPFAGRGRFVARLVGLGLIVAATAAFVPAALLVVPVVAVALLAGSFLAGRVMGGIRTLAVALAATALAAVLLLPWSAEVLGGWRALFGVAPGPTARLGIGAVLRFDTGPFGGGVLAWGLVVAAILPLLIGRSWRLAWAIRLWTVALTCWALVWAASRGSLPIPMATPEVLLAPAAAALAGAVALGAVAFDVDLPGYRFGWRQLASSVAAAAVLVGSLPILAGSVGGRWHVPDGELANSLGFLAESRTSGAFRVLWVGDPRALPLGGWTLETGVGYATSDSGMPDVTNQWPARSAGATPLLATDLRLARAQRTTLLGHLLAPLAVRYIVVPNRAAPSTAHAPQLPQPQDILTALGLQVDLRTVQVDQALTVYENAAWVPERSLLPPGAVDNSRSGAPEAAQTADLSGAMPVLDNAGQDRFTGPVPSGAEVLVSATRNRRWGLSVSGHAANQRPAFGWAMAFSVPEGGGPATLRFHPPTTRAVALVAETLLWLVAALAVVVDFRRAGPVPLVPPRPETPLGDHGQPPEPALVGARRRSRRMAEPVGLDPSDEEWA